jgi:hypothetical protein
MSVIHPRYLGSKDREDGGLRPAQAKKKWDILKIRFRGKCI